MLALEYTLHLKAFESAVCDGEKVPAFGHQSRAQIVTVGWQLSERKKVLKKARNFAELKA